MPQRKSTIGKNPLDTASGPAEADAASGESPRSEARAGSPQRVVQAWAAATEAVLESTFAAQNARLVAELSVLETSAAANRRAIERWSDAVREAQRAAMAAFHANIEAAERVTSPPRRRSLARQDSNQDERG
jgi:hypothetical protein